MKQPMTHDEDPDMVNSMKALMRASKRARKLAEETGTGFVVVDNGVLVREVPQSPKIAKQKSRRSSSP